MKLEDLIEEHRTYYQIAKAYGFQQSTVFYWSKIGRVPLRAQAIIAYKTDYKYKITMEEDEHV